MKISPSILLLCLLAVGCGGNSSNSSATIDSAKAESLVQGYKTARNRLGVAAAIVKGTSLAWSKGFGTANLQLKTPVTPDTVFVIASITKTITGTAAMQLVEQGKLDLDKDINTYLPFSVRSPDFPSRAITMRQLLSHTAGISDENFNSYGAPSSIFFFPDGVLKLSLADFCKGFLSTGGAYYNATSFTGKEPGTACQYCNLGMSLAGYIVERVAGQSLNDFCRAHIFNPLGMKRTSFRVQDFQPKDLAMPYDETLQPIGHYVESDYPDGNLRSTVNDLSRFLRAFINGGSLNGARILSQTSVAEMRKVQYPDIENAQGQALAWDYSQAGSYGQLLGHFGAYYGTLTAMRYNPATNTGMIVFMNQFHEDISEVEPLLQLISDLIGVGEKG
jgi:CubicO group peptidase (beta-lactamase class C family)